MTWSLSHIERLVREGKVKGYVVVPKSGDKCGKRPAEAKKSNIPAGLKHIKQVLDDKGIKYVTEYQFAKTRKFRFDIAIPELMTAIEYEGLVSTGKKGGHQTKTHYTNNCTKYNLAANKGWKVLRYTFKNYKDFENDLK